MNELMFNKYQHLSYVLGTDFKKRMFDMYIGMTSADRPPYLDDILRESTQMQALVVLEEIRDMPEYAHVSSEEWERLHEEVWQDDEAAKLSVLDMFSPKEAEGLIVDTLHFIETYHMSIVVRQPNQWRLHQLTILNSPVREIW